MAQEPSTQAVQASLACRWSAALALVGTVGALVTIRVDPIWPQVTAALGVGLVAVLSWAAPTHRTALRVVAAVTLLLVLWLGWALWQGRWTVSVWLLLTAVALLAVLLLTVPAVHQRLPATVPVSLAVVLLLTSGAWLGGGALARSTAEISQVAAAPLTLVDGQDTPGAYPYRWSNHANTHPIDTAYGTVRLGGASTSRVVATAGSSEPAWSYELRPYEIVDMLTSSSGEVVLLQFRQQQDTVARTDLAAPVTRVWLDAQTGAVLDTISWQRRSNQPDDSGEQAALAATGRDWVIYEPTDLYGDRVTYQDVLVGRHRIDTRVRVGLAFHPGGPQQVAWTRDPPERCAEHVLWSSRDRAWTLAADATTVAVARACVAEPAEDGTAQVSVSVHGVEASTGQDTWVVEGPEAVSFEDWTADYPDTDERILDDAVSSAPTGQNVVTGVQVAHGEHPSDPVVLRFVWGGGVDEPEVTVDLATGS